MAAWCELDSSATTEEGPLADACEHDNEPSDSIQGDEFHDHQ
jgi:hypothetical protein